MATKLKMPVTIGDRSQASWYYNSMDPLVRECRGSSPHGRKDPFAGLFELYEETYNVKLEFDSYGFIEGVIFPSEEEATMFLLRWQ